MTTTNYKLKINQSNTLKLKTRVPFPTSVVGAGGIKVSKSNGNWTIEPDFGALANITEGAVTDLTIKEVWVFDTITGVYNTIKLSDIHDVLSPLTTLGDTLYHDATQETRLAGNTSATRKFLSQTGTGTVSAAPIWVQPTQADIVGLTTADSPTFAGLTVNSPSISTVAIGNTSTATQDILEFRLPSLGTARITVVPNLPAASGADFFLGAGRFILTVPAGAPGGSSLTIQSAGTLTGSIGVNVLNAGYNESFSGLAGGLSRGASFAFTKKAGGTGNREGLVAEYVAETGSGAEYIQGGLFIGTLSNVGTNFSSDVFGSISVARIGAGFTGFSNQVTGKEIDVICSSPVFSCVGLQIVNQNAAAGTIGAGRNAALMMGSVDAATPHWKYMIDVGYVGGASGGVSEFTSALFHADRGTIPYFFDFSTATASTASWKGKFSVDGQVVINGPHPPMILSAAGTNTLPQLDTNVANAMASWEFCDQGTIKWIVGKNPTNSFTITDFFTSHDVLTSALGSDTVTLGVPAINAGKLAFANLTSGTVTLTPQTGALGSAVLTLPAATDTLVGRATTDTLTNKTLTSPILTTPTLGVATATSINKVAITAPATSATLTIANGKTLTASNTLTLTATDGATLAIGGGGTLGTAAYAATGTTGHALPFTDGTNIWTGANTFTQAFTVFTNNAVIGPSANAGGGISIGWNRSGGGAEANIYCVYNGGAGLDFWQNAGTTTYTKMASMTTTDFIGAGKLYSTSTAFLIGRLYSLLRPGGHLVFTANGETTAKVQHVFVEALDAKTGFGYLPYTDQFDLDVSIYGSTISLPKYVEHRIVSATNGEAKIENFSPGEWWMLQDQWVVHKPGAINV